MCCMGALYGPPERGHEGGTGTPGPTLVDRAQKSSSKETDPSTAIW